MEGEGVALREFVVKTCRESKDKCKECKESVSVFDRQRFTDHVALANRSYLYDLVEKGPYNQFVELMKKK